MAGLLILLGVAALVAIALLTALIAREVLHPPRRTTAYAVARNLPCDPGELGLEFAEWWLDRPDGARLAVWEAAGDCEAQQPFRGRARQAPTVMFIHSWGESRIDMLRLTAAWSRIASRLVFYDRRGHGDAAGGRARLGAGEAEDLLAVIEQTHGEDEIDKAAASPILLAGHGTGAAIALAAARKAHQRVHGVVLYAPVLNYPSHLAGQLAARGHPVRPMLDLLLLLLRLHGRRALVIEADAEPPSCEVLRFPAMPDDAAAHAERLCGFIRLIGPRSRAAASPHSGDEPPCGAGG